MMAFIGTWYAFLWYKCSYQYESGIQGKWKVVTTKFNTFINENDILFTIPRHKLSTIDKPYIRSYRVTYFGTVPGSFIVRISGIKSLLDHKYRTLIEDKFISF